jgi:hypothetical protein
MKNKKQEVKQNTKATMEALSYISDIFRVCYQDCSDSMEECKSYEDRFNALVDDKISIEDYIEKFLLEKYVEAWKSFTEEELYDYSQEDKENPTVRDLPIPYKKFKHLL